MGVNSLICAQAPKCTRILSPADKLHNFNLSAGYHSCGFPIALVDDVAVEFHRYPVIRNPQFVQKLEYGLPFRNSRCFPVHQNFDLLQGLVYLQRSDTGDLYYSGTSGRPSKGQSLFFKCPHPTQRSTFRYLFKY
jgi:hypothetical protein